MSFKQKNLAPVLLLALFSAITFFSACKKDPEEVIELLTNSEAAEIIEDAISNRTAGITLPAIDAAQIIEMYLNSCNVPGDTTLHKDKAGGVATYDYTFNLDWLLTCSNLNVPQSAKVDIAANGSFTSPHWTGTEATAGNLIYTGLNTQEPAYLINGSYDLNGNVTGSLRNVSPALTCVVKLNLTNLSLNKSTLKIETGSGTAKVIATSANGETKTLNGSFTFTGNNSVEVVVNGYTHSFQW